MMDIEVIDHVIIGNNRYYSLRESNGDLFATKKWINNKNNNWARL